MTNGMGGCVFISPRDNEYCHVLTSSEMASAKTESERLAGWNQAKVDKYNKEHPEHHATITYVLQHENRRRILSAWIGKNSL